MKAVMGSSLFNAELQNVKKKLSTNAEQSTDQDPSHTPNLNPI